MWFPGDVLNEGKRSKTNFLTIIMTSVLFWNETFFLGRAELLCSGQIDNYIQREVYFIDLQNVYAGIMKKIMERNRGSDTTLLKSNTLQVKMWKLSFFIYIYFSQGIFIRLQSDSKDIYSFIRFYATFLNFFCFINES